MSKTRFYRVPRARRSCRGTYRLRPQFEVLETRLALSVTLLSEDFDDDAVDTQPNTADYVANATGPEGFIQVGGPGGTYGTPIGPNGNHSLIIDNPGEAQPAISWNTIFSDDPTDFQSGTISFDLYMPEPSPSKFWTYIDIRLGYGFPGRTAPTTVADTTVWNSFRVNSASADVVVDNGNGGGSSPISSFTELHVVYEIYGATQTYQLSINGTPVNFGSGNPNHPWIAGAPGINMVAFVGAFPVTSNALAIDNLMIVQEEIEPPQPWTPPANEPTDLLEWHQHRGNKRLTGEATISQDIVSGASILWSEFIGSRESWTAVTPNGGNLSTVDLPSSNISMSQSELISWDLNGPYFDLGGTGTLTAESTGSFKRIGDFIPGNGVLEKLEGETFDTTFGQGVIRLFVYNNGNWVQQWQSQQIPAMFGTANIITGDFDNDGQLEVAITPWTDLYLLDMATGQVEDTVRFKPAANESGRPYGWLGAYDLTGDGREEFIEHGDFQDFISVMGWDAGGNLIKLWDHAFDPRLTNKQTIARPTAFPVRDVTGNGQLNIVTSVFNETGDNRWHIVTFDALTGNVINDLVDHVIDGSRDINNDGDYELFVRQTQGALLSETATIKILDWNGGGYDTLWSQTDSGFVSQDLSDFPLNVNSATATGKRDLLTGPIDPGGQDVFFTRQILDATTNEARVNIWQLDGAGGVVSLGSAVGVNLNALAVRETTDDTPSILFTAEVVGDNSQLDADFNSDRRRDGADYLAWQRGFGITSGATLADGDANNDGAVDDVDLNIWQQNFGQPDPAAIQLLGFDGAPVFSSSGAPPRSSAVVGRLNGPADDPTLIVQGGSNTIVALQPQQGGQVNTAWVRAGLGGFTGATQFQGQHQNSGVALGDVDGNGILETIYATQGEAGQARLVVANPDGSELWHADFDVPGGQRVWNQPGMTQWRTGNFTSTDHEDVLVQIMRGIGGTGEFYMLDGVTGQVLWTRDYGNTPGTFATQRGAGEAHLAVYDWDGDGLDEAVNFNPDMFYVVDGNGLNLIDKSVLGGGVFPGGSPLYATPIVADFLNNGTDTIVFGASYAQYGLVNKNGAAIWNTPFIFDDTPGFLQGIGDVDNDGDLDLMSVGHPDAPATHTNSIFHAYDAATGQLLWQIDLPGRPFAPVGGAYSDTPTLSVSADVDGDGRVESIFAISNTLYAVGADPGGTSGSIEWTFTPDGGLLGSPIIADSDGDGQAEIIVVSTSGMVYGIGTAAPVLVAAASATSTAAALADTPKIASYSRTVDAAIVLWMKGDVLQDQLGLDDQYEPRQNIDTAFASPVAVDIKQPVANTTRVNRFTDHRQIQDYNYDSQQADIDEVISEEVISEMDFDWIEF